MDQSQSLNLSIQVTLALDLNLAFCLTHKLSGTYITITSLALAYLSVPSQDLYQDMTDKNSITTISQRICSRRSSHEPNILLIVQLLK